MHDKQSRQPSRRLSEGRRSQDKTEQSKVHSVNEAGSDDEELLFETITVDCTDIGIERNTVFA